VIHVPHDLPQDKFAIGLSLDKVVEPVCDQDPLHLIRKVCLRFHAVARHLRLRKDYRPTVEVDDEYDLQDLLCALLKVEFDEVATEDWIPPYAGGASRTTLFVNRDQIAIVAKKTGPGQTTKELTDHIMTDAAHYRTQGRCSTLFCFVYDPEGRIGSPKRLETTLTSVSEHCRIEVLVAPK
jgi:REase_DpnII-MboI